MKKTNMTLKEFQREVGILTQQSLQDINKFGKVRVHLKEQLHKIEMKIYCLIHKKLILKDEITDRTLSNINGYLNDKTYIESSIIMPYSINKVKKISFFYGRTEHELLFEEIKNESGTIKSEGMVLVGDKFGIFSKSSVTIKSYYGYKRKEPLKLDETLVILNHFIKSYRNVMKEYWLEPITEGSFLEYVSILKINGVEQRRTIEYPNAPNSYYINKQETKLEEIQKLKEDLDKGERKIWKELLITAYGKTYKKDYSEAILIMNIAFETFIDTELLPLIKEEMNKKRESYDDFINGKLYETSPFYSYLTKEDFDKLVENNVTPKADTYKINKKAVKLKIINESQSKVKNIINKIRKYRNDITHGRGEEKTKEELKLAFENGSKAFEKYVDLVMNQ